MKHGEQRGVWFRLNKADELRRASGELGEARKQLGWYDRLDKVRDGQVVAYTSALDERRAALVAVQEVNSVLVRDARRARGERDAAKAELGRWYRSPVLWVTVGIVATLVAGGITLATVSK
jgi:hypothetical protein